VAIEPTQNSKQELETQMESEVPNGVQLSEAEALDLASHLKEKLKAGLAIDSDPNSISLMVAGLGDPRGLLRLRFADSLGSIGKVAVPALCQAMIMSDQVTVRRAAAKTLTLIADPSSLPDLVSALLSDPDSVVQGSAMGAMAAIGAEAVGEILAILENPESSEMQIGLANWALAFIGDRAPDALREAACSDNNRIRKAAISALGSQIQSLDDGQAKELLTNALGDPCSEIRSEAATLLGKLEDSEWAEPLLIPALSDPDNWVRKNSALALMKLGAINSIPHLKGRIAIENDQIIRNVLDLSINQLEKMK
jgi:bilin biosynthesis protein|tara:strand:+ start:5226 stop:6155 length:930 start_codon:yes stop_codon:yes gene_type:complete